MPSPKKAAERSSTILKQLKKGFSVKPIVKGAFLEPGDIIIFLTPLALQVETIALADGIMECFMQNKNTN